MVHSITESHALDISIYVLIMILLSWVPPFRPGEVNARLVGQEPLGLSGPLEEGVWVWSPEPGPNWPVRPSSLRSTCASTLGLEDPCLPCLATQLSHCCLLRSEEGTLAAVSARLGAELLHGHGFRGTNSCPLPHHGGTLELLARPGLMPVHPHPPTQVVNICATTMG